MKEEKTKNDGFETGLAEKTEECAWCGKVIHHYMSNNKITDLIRESGREFEKELKYMMISAGFKPIQFEMNNSGVRIMNFISARQTSLIEKIVEEIEGKKKKIELSEPRLYQSNPALNEMGGYSSVPFYCSLCGLIIKQDL